jgi:hypothetical protein
LFTYTWLVVQPRDTEELSIPEERLYSLATHAEMCCDVLARVQQFYALDFAVIRF